MAISLKALRAYKFKPYSHNGEIYIHSRPESFMMNNEQYSSVASFYQSEIVSNYRNAKNMASARMRKLYGQAGAKSEKEKKDIEKMLYGIFAMSNEKSKMAEDIIGKGLKDAAIQQINSIKENIGPMALKGGQRFVMVQEDKLNWLNSILKSVNSLDGDLQKLDKQLLETFLDTEEKPKALTLDKKTRLVHYDKTATTSLNNLIAQLDEIRKIADSTTADGNAPVFKQPPGKVMYKGKEADFTKILWAIGQQTLNVQGSLLEGTTYAIVQKAINEGILAPFAKEGQMLRAEKMGGSSNKSDIALQIVETGDGGVDIVFSLGISSKSTTVKPGSKTVFETSSWSKIIKQANLMNSLVEYKLANAFVHGKTSTSEVGMLRRYVASKDIGRAIMGSGSDTVYYIQTLNTLTSVEELFEEIESNQNYLDLVPEGNSMKAAFAYAKSAREAGQGSQYARSKAALELVRKVNMQYTFKHL